MATQKRCANPDEEECPGRRAWPHADRLEDNAAELDTVPKVTDATREARG